MKECKLCGNTHCGHLRWNNRGKRKKFKVYTNETRVYEVEAHTEEQVRGSYYLNESTCLNVNSMEVEEE